MSCLCFMAYVRKWRKITNELDALRIFEEYRFDIEEHAEALIEDEEFNASGEVEIK